MIYLFNQSAPRVRRFQMFYNPTKLEYREPPINGMYALQYNAYIYPRSRGIYSGVLGTAVHVCFGRTRVCTRVRSEFRVYSRLNYQGPPEYILCYGKHILVCISKSSAWFDGAPPPRPPNPTSPHPTPLQPTPTHPTLLHPTSQPSLHRTRGGYASLLA